MVRLRDIMTAHLVTVSPKTSIREAMELLGKHHVSGAPVIRGAALVGVVSATDVMTFASALSGVPTERETNEDWSEWAEATAGNVQDDPEAGSTFFAEMWDDDGADTLTRATSLAGPEWNSLEEHDVSEVQNSADIRSRPGTHCALN